MNRACALRPIALRLLAPAALIAGVALADAPPEPRAMLDQAVAMRIQGNYAAMESLATLACLRLEASTHPDTALLAEAWYDVCHSKNLRHQMSDSTGLLAGLRAAELLRSIRNPPDTLVLSVHRTLGFTYTERSMPREGIEHYRVALGIARHRPDWGPLPISVVLYNLGTTLASAGENDSSLAAFRQSLEFRRRLRQPRDVLFGGIYAGMGMVFEAEGRPDSAEAAFQIAIRTDEEQVGPDHPILVGPLSRAAAFEQRRGDYARSIDYSRRGLQVLQGHTPSEELNRLIMRCDIALALEEFGDVEQARHVYEETLPKLDSTIGRQHAQALAGWLYLAAACSKLGDLSRAREAYEHVRNVFAEDSSITARAPLAVALSGLARLLLAQGATDSALALAQQAEAVNRTSGASDLMPTLEALCIQMSCHAARGDWGQVDSVDARLSRELSRFALEGNNQSDFVWITRSEVAEVRGRHADAVSAAAEGARQARERLSRNVRALSDRQALLLANSLSAPLDQLLAVAAGSDSASLHAAWDAVVRTRGLVRAEISRRRFSLPASADSAAVGAHDEWIRAEQRLAQYEVRTASSTRDAAGDSTLAAMRAEVDDSEHRWARDLPDRAIPTDPERIGIDSVLSHLAVGQALAAFAQVPGRQGQVHLVALVARGGSSAPRSIDLGNVDGLRALLDPWLAQLGEPDPKRRSESTCRRAGFRIRASVWDRVARAAGGARDLFIVPEAPVAGIPWGALPEGHAAYIVETGVRIHVLDSERELASEPVGRTGRGLLAVGGVDYDRELHEATPAPTIAIAIRSAPSECDSGALGHLPPLPGTREEVRDVEASWSMGSPASGSVTALEGDIATESAFKRLAPGMLVVHVATHGVALSDTCGRATPGTRGVGGVAPMAESGRSSRKDSERPQGASPGTTALAFKVPARKPGSSPWLGRQVFLALANANHAREHLQDENEGLLTAEEITTLDLRGVDWVVLSACQTAAGETWTREGFLGMQRAFHLAGARTVIASRWSVEDEATRQWMRALYVARAGGSASAAQAMAASSRSVLKSRRQSGRSTHPFYWAAFIASGE
jgi:tetratricopeptide (TPR) repeat protein